MKPANLVHIVGVCGVVAIFAYYGWPRPARTLSLPSLPMVEIPQAGSKAVADQEGQDSLYYDKAHIEHANQSASALAGIGRDRFSQHDLAGAETAYRQATMADPTSAGVRGSLGTIELREGKRDAAAQDFRAALALDPNELSALAGLASLAAGSGDNKQALDLYRRLLVVDPNSRAGLWGLALICDRLGRATDALVSFRQFLDLYPKDEYAPGALKRIPELEAAVAKNQASQH
jgi:cytochrome c-type biogenesis protein CcmH/NrfG